MASPDPYTGYNSKAARLISTSMKVIRDSENVPEILQNQKTPK